MFPHYEPLEFCHMKLTCTPQKSEQVMTVIATPRRLSMIRIIRYHPWVYVHIHIWYGIARVE